MAEAEHTSAAHQRQGFVVHANIIRACGECQAPGVFKCDQVIADGWPGCYVQPDDSRVDQPVGDSCPNCGAIRPAPEPQGEIARGTYDG